MTPMRRRWNVTNKKHTCLLCDDTFAVVLGLIVALGLLCAWLPVPPQ